MGRLVIRKGLVWPARKPVSAEVLPEKVEPAESKDEELDTSIRLLCATLSSSIARAKTIAVSPALPPSEYQKFALDISIELAGLQRQLLLMAGIEPNPGPPFKLGLELQQDGLYGGQHGANKYAPTRMRELQRLLSSGVNTARTSVISPGKRRRRALQRFRNRLKKRGLTKEQRLPLVKERFPTYQGEGAYRVMPGSKIAARRGKGSYFTDAMRILGGGAYTVTGGTAGSDTLVSDAIVAAPVPVMHSTADYIDVYRRECLGDVITSATPGAFEATTIPINPGMSELLVWGNTIFTQFQQWEAVGLEFQFHTSSSVYSTTQQLGSVMMATDYDVLSPAPSSKLEMEMLTGSSQTVISNNLSHFVECDPKQSTSKIKFVRTGPVSGDLHYYDLGNFTIATAGVATASQNIGSLYVSYHFRAYKPKLGAAAAIDMLSVNCASTSGSYPLGTSRTVLLNNMGAVYGADATHQYYEFPIGTYGTFYVLINWVGGSVTTAIPSIYTTNMSHVTTYMLDGVYAPPNGTTTSSGQIYGCMVTIDDPSLPSRVGFTNDGTVGTSCALLVTETHP